MWDYNARMKFEENAATIRSLRTAGFANVNTAIEGILSAGADVASGLSDNSAAKAGGSTSDPTVTNPELFGNGIPGQYSDYLRMRSFFGKYSNN